MGGKITTASGDLEIAPANNIKLNSSFIQLSNADLNAQEVKIQAPNRDTDPPSGMTDGINIEIIAGDATTNGGGDGGDIS